MCACTLRHERNFVDLYVNELMLQNGRSTIISFKQELVYYQVTAAQPPKPDGVLFFPFQICFLGNIKDQLLWFITKSEFFAEVYT